MIVFVSVTTRQAFFIIHPLVAFSFYTPSTCISLFLLSSHCEHFIPPPKKCTVIIKWQKTLRLINVQSLCGRHLRQKLAPCFLGMTVHVCHSLLYIYVSNRYHMYLHRLSTSWACSWNDKMLVVSMTTNGYLHI